MFVVVVVVVKHLYISSNGSKSNPVLPCSNTPSELMHYNIYAKPYPIKLPNPDIFLCKQICWSLGNISRNPR